MKENGLTLKKGAYFGLFLAALAVSAIRPHDYFTWFLEIAPAVLGMAAVAIVWRRTWITPLLLTAIMLHCFILMIGGHYTYALVPGFTFDLPFLGGLRNNFDKIGHFAQGFVPALAAGELFIRRRVVNGNAWRNFLVVAVCLAISAAYEFIEWWVSLATGEAGDSFLGTQGFVWDTQTDMFMCTVGAILAVAILGKLHQRQIAACQAAATSVPPRASDGQSPGR